MTTEPAVRPTWSLLSNHGHVLLCIAGDSQIRGRDIAARVGVTERAAQSIVADLVDAGFVGRERVGRRNVYEVNEDVAMRHPVESHHSVGELIDALGPPSEP